MTVEWKTAADLSFYINLVKVSLNTKTFQKFEKCNKLLHAKIFTLIVPTFYIELMFSQLNFNLYLSLSLINFKTSWEINYSFDSEGVSWGKYSLEHFSLVLYSTLYVYNNMDC